MDWSKPFVPAEWNIDAQIQQVSKRVEALQSDIVQREQKLKMKSKAKLNNSSTSNSIRNKTENGQRNSIKGGSTENAGNYLNWGLKQARYSGLLGVTVQRYKGESTEKVSEIKTAAM